MSSLTLEQAARASGRSAREIRLLLEEGRLRGAVRAGRWQVEPSEVDGLALEARVGDLPNEPRLRAVSPAIGTATSDAPSHPTGAAAVEELVSRLEQRAVEVARLRGELEALREGRNEHGARVERELDGLRRELGQANAQLERARERIEELEAGPGSAQVGRAVEQPRGPGMSEELSPLFKST
jgi:hypothetical protein